jgi:hypothetical protein
MSEEKQRQIKVNFPKELVGGAYANNLMVQHSRDEFILDFMMLSPPAGTVTSRVITSPSQVKRILQALQENIGKYEKTYGTIELPEGPKGQVDFNPGWLGNS